MPVQIVANINIKVYSITLEKVLSKQTKFVLLLQDMNWSLIKKLVFFGQVICKSNILNTNKPNLFIGL